MARSLQALHQWELDGCRRSFEAGNPSAVLAAINWCRKHDVIQPPWLVDATNELLVDAIRNAKSGKPGRANNPLSRLRQDLIHFSRHDAVQEVREQQKLIAVEFAELRTEENVPPSIMEEREYMLEWLGRSWEMAYRCAAALLRGTEAYGSPSTIKASYCKIQKISKNPEEAIRYRLIDRHTMEKLGLLAVFEPPRGRKPSELFDPDH